MSNNNVYLSSLFGGGVAGLTVDVSLYPLDTIKTRLQSQQGFLKTGGFKGIYKGLGPQVIGSVPTAALFFCTYESFKKTATPYVASQYAPLIHMTAASLGEVVACTIRVPVEVVKQRRQVSSGTSSVAILLNTCRTEGIRKGLYRGFLSTVLREIPFAFIQFPIYEYFKVVSSKLFYDGKTIPSYNVALCGAFAGSIAAASTTPLDVVKTRIMLSENKIGINRAMARVYHEKGLKGLFAGFVPRVLWITLGGAIFFGSYDVARNAADNYLFNVPVKNTVI